MPPRTVTRVLNRKEWGDDPGTERLIYQKMRAIARRVLRSGSGVVDEQELTGLVNEAWIKLLRTERWDSRAHFFGSAARAMRQVLVEEARRRNAQKRSAKVSALRTDPEEKRAGELSRALELDEALRVLERENERAARVAEAKLFGEMPDETIAELLGVSVRTVERDRKFVRAWMRERFGW